MTLTFKVGTQMLRATRRLNMVSVKLFQNPTSNNEVMGRTQMGRTDGRTDGQGDDYMLPRNFFGEHKNLILRTKEGGGRSFSFEQCLFSKQLCFLQL